jgi:iron complex outermembrane receptor protein
MIRRLAVAAAMVLTLCGSARAQSTTPSTTQPADSIRSYWIEPIEVIARRVAIGRHNVPLARDNIGAVLARNGFDLIRRGVFFAQDIYADGLKRGDITVVVDGERYHSACPNRMDSPLTRINPLDFSGVDLVKTGTDVQSGLGGLVEFRRREPQDPMQLAGSVSGSAGAMGSADVAAALESHRQRVSLRYATGEVYHDGDGRSFTDAYGYRDNARYTLAEINAHGDVRQWRYGGGFSYTGDVSFPYLQMDERENNVLNASLGRVGYRLYINYTDHRMDNALRRSPMAMTTDATNLTVGATGARFDAFYRNWKSDNIMVTPMGTITNRMIADAHVGAVSVRHRAALGDAVLSARAGVNAQALGDDDRIAFNRALYPGAESDRLFPTFAIAASYTRSVSRNLGAGVFAETASDAPQTQALFIAVRKPAGKVWWAGNPTLDAPVRTTARASVGYRWLQIEAFTSYILNYVELAGASAGAIDYMTYRNVDALLTGMNAQITSSYLDVDASYVWAENRTTGHPLSEIAPLRVRTRVTSPPWRDGNLLLTHTYSDAQTRVDESLGETGTPSWNQIDVGARLSHGVVEVRFDVENLTDETYYRHLSYLRDPFSSGIRVYEPGRTFRLSLLVQR